MPVTVATVVPALALVKGGEPVTITGTGFATAVKVTFGNVKAGDVVRVNATTITATAPKQSLGGPVTVTVTNDPGYLWSGESGSCPNPFNYYPIVEGVEPRELGTAGGAVTITGQGFPVGAHVVVRDGGGAYAAAGIARASATQITCTLPQHDVGEVHLCVLVSPVDGNAVPFSVEYCEPFIASVTPSSGRTGGNNDVVITGKYFAHNVSVAFDGVPAAAVNRQSSTELRVQPAAHAAGAVEVTVTNPYRPLGSAPAVPPSTSEMSDGYEYKDSEILSIEPSRGPASGNTPVVIKGRGLLALAVNGVQIGGVAAINQNLVDDETVHATTQAAPAGPGDVSVQNNLGDPAAVLAGAFTFVALPTVTAVDPARGPIGTVVTVQGTLFEQGATVSFGGVAATGVTVASPTAIRCTVPPHGLGAVDVVVRNRRGDPATLANGYTYTRFSVEPTRGLAGGGEQVTLLGLGEAPKRVRVDGNVVAHAAGDTITFTTPAHAVGPVSVDVDGDVLANAFEFAAITRLEPNSGPAGTTVIIHGAGFDDTTAVTFDGTPAAPVQVLSPTRISVASPAHADGAVDVVVTNAGAGTFPGGYTYRAAATVTGVRPAVGSSAGGTTVTITGTDFVRGAKAYVAGVELADVEVLSPTTIRGKTPAAAGGPPFVAEAVTVRNPGAENDAVGDDLFTYRPPPAVTAAADPAVGPDSGGRAVVLTGTDFVQGARVIVDATEVTDVTFVDATTLRFRVPAHAVGAVAIAVRNPEDGAAGAARAATFTYVADQHTATGGNECRFLLDGENFFEFLRLNFEVIRTLPRDPLTYVRMAFWDAEPEVTCGDRNHFLQPNHTLVNYVERTARAGHNVELILWRPNGVESKFGLGKEVYEPNRKVADKLYAIDRALAGVPNSGRVRVYFEHSEGETGSSLHQKIAIFSFAGERHVTVGGLNLSNGYFASDDHQFPPLAAQCRPWHDAAVYLCGPVTDDVEREWMRRWKRTRALEGEWYGLANVYGHAGEFLARDFSFFESGTVRRRAVEAVENTRPQPLQLQNTAVTIATTRSVGSTRYRNIRDKVIERIRAADQYIYFENYHFCDPDLVQAIVARHRERTAAGANLRVAIVVPRDMGADSSYLTRRAWLHFALTFEDGTVGPPAPYCTHVVYDIGAGPVTVARAACGANWNVHDCYDPNSPKATSWLENDTLTFDAGAGPVTVKFHQILAVAAGIHFYCPVHLHGSGNTNIVYTHAKIAAFDDRWMVIGSSNWSFRSMQYDAEISAFIDSNAFTAPAMAQLLAHYDPNAPTPLNLEARALANFAAAVDDTIALYPCEYFDALSPYDAATNPGLPFSRAVPRAFKITNGLTFAKNPAAPNYTWL